MALILIRPKHVCRDSIGKVGKGLCRRKYCKTGRVRKQRAIAEREPVAGMVETVREGDEEVVTFVL